MKLLTLVSSVEILEFFKVTLKASAGFLGFDFEFNKWENKTDFGLTVNIALGIVSGSVSIHANK